MNNSPVLREAILQASASRGKAIQASLYPNPFLATASPQLAGNVSQYNVFASQDIVTKGKLGLDTAAAQRSVRQAELNAIRARYEVLTTVRQRFYIALAAQRRVELLEDLTTIANKSRETGDRLLKGGEGSRTDLVLLEIELERAQVARENAATLLEADKRQLVNGMGVPDLFIPRLAGNLNAELPKFDDLVAVEAGVVATNAQSQSAQQEIARTNILLRRAQVEPFPNFNFMGGYQYSVQPLNDQAIYQVTAEIPLWDRNQGNIRAAQANVGASRAALGRVRNELANQTAAALGRYITAQQQVDRYEERILPRARESQRLTQQLYAEGQLDFLRLLQAQRTLGEANLGYINAQEQRWTAAAEIAGLLQSDTFP